MRSYSDAHKKDKEIEIREEINISITNAKKKTLK